VNQEITIPQQQLVVNRLNPSFMTFVCFANSLLQFEEDDKRARAFHYFRVIIYYLLHSGIQTSVNLPA
jgi:hypothetical protein